MGCYEKTLSLAAEIKFYYRQLEFSFQNIFPFLIFLKYSQNN